MKKRQKFMAMLLGLLGTRTALLGPNWQDTVCGQEDAQYDSSHDIPNLNCRTCDS